MTIRPIQEKDNAQIEKVIKDVLISYGANREGFAFVDPELADMFQAYSPNSRAYYVLEENSEILGGAGIAELNEPGKNYCELQKMYFHPRARSWGYGRQIMELCLNFARQQGYSHCYLETISEMTEAQNLYRSVGFDYIEIRLGNTGHSSCPVFMLKQL